MAEYRKCRECESIHRAGDLEREEARDPLVLKGFCPDCGCSAFDDVQAICNSCEKAEAAKDDDFCAACRDLEDEKDYERDLDAVIEERRVKRIRRDLGEIMGRIGRGITDEV